MIFLLTLWVVTMDGLSCVAPKIVASTFGPPDKQVLSPIDLIGIPVWLQQ